jgi:hypothetical protein
MLKKVTVTLTTMKEDMFDRFLSLSKKLNISKEIK